MDATQIVAADIRSESNELLVEVGSHGDGTGAPTGRPQQAAPAEEGPELVGPGADEQCGGRVQFVLDVATI